MKPELRIRRRQTVSSSGGGSGTDSFANPDTWHYIGDTDEPALENGFTTVGSSGSNHLRPGFRKVGDYLELQGLFIGAASTTMFTLPVGFRPAISIHGQGFSVIVDLLSGGADNAFDGISILSTGEVKSGANAPGYGLTLWSLVVGQFYPLTPPELT